MSRDATYFIAPCRDGSWRVVKVLEHGPYHDTRPRSWIGPYNQIAARDAAEARSAPRDQQNWEDERQLVADLPDGPFCSMCAAKSVSETGEICDACYETWNQKPRVKPWRMNRKAPLPSITYGQALRLFTDWHVDEVTDRHAAHVYAVRLIRRIEGVADGSDPHGERVP